MNTERARTVSGGAFIAAGTVTVLGIITAAALVPGYSTATQTISALGSSRGTPASRLVFNGAMILTGLLTTIAAYGIHHVYERRLLTGVLVTTGIGGSMAVGLFPEQTGLAHTIAAVVAFGGMGLTALVVSRTVRGPFRAVSAVFGTLELTAFGLFVTLRGSTPLGIGGLERWVAYLGVLWVLAFGGFLLPGYRDH